MGFNKSNRLATGSSKCNGQQRFVFRYIDLILFFGVGFQRILAQNPCEPTRLPYPAWSGVCTGLTPERKGEQATAKTETYYKSVRYLAENAGSMQVVQGDGNPKTGHQLDRSEHFQLFLHCLGLPSQIPAKQWVWDTGPFFGIRRQRVFLRSHLDTGVPPSGITPGNEVWGPLI